MKQDPLDEEGENEIIFEPDDALILALNEIHDLKQLVETQDSAIEELKSQLSILAKKIN
jgi:hypothetical protein